MPNPEKPEIQKFQEQVEDLEAQLKEQFPEPEKMSEGNESLRRTAEAMIFRLLKDIDKAQNTRYVSKETVKDYEELDKLSKLKGRIIKLWQGLGTHSKSFIERFDKADIVTLHFSAIRPEEASLYPHELDSYDITECVAIGLKPKDPMIRKIVQYKNLIEDTNHSVGVENIVALIKAKIPRKEILYAMRTTEGRSGDAIAENLLNNPQFRKVLQKEIRELR